MRTKQEIVADATVRFTELNKSLVTASLPPFPIETAYANIADDLNGEDAVVNKWFNECMRKTEELGASIPTGVRWHPTILQFKLQLTLIDTISEIHTQMLKLLIITEASEVTLH